MKIRSLLVVAWVAVFLGIATSSICGQNTTSQHFNGLPLPVEVCGELIIMTVDIHILVQNGKVKHIDTQGNGETASGDQYSLNLSYNTHNTLNLNGGGTFCDNVATIITGQGQAPNINTHLNHCFQLGAEGLVELVSVDTENSQCN